MSKVKCKVCVNELSGICSIKKVGVRVNKPRTCETFVFSPGKIKLHTEVPTIRFGYKEQQEQKRKRKEEIERAKRLLEERKQTKFVETTVPSSNSKYPLTGDLSRFMTSASKNEG